MENESPAGPPGADARAALSTLAADRGRLSERLAPPWWYYPTLSLVTAAFVASPGAATPGAQSSLVAAACVGLVFLTEAYRRTTGFSVSRAAGMRSLVVAAVQGILFLGLFVTSVVLAKTGHDDGVPACVVAAFVVMLGGGLLYERVYRAELGHVAR
ncbi:hypothetical protein [Isoptericola sp. NPDC057391]|uniref:hypothetical protein n=1 Tax=Isoptericola sp. NPDC057391 TaxID=3346117 RepID=UPI00362AD209